MTTSTPAAMATPPSALSRYLGVRISRFAATSLHLVMSLPLSILMFVLPVVAAALGLGLLVIYPVGLAFIVAFIAGARGFARFERARLGALLAVRIRSFPALGATDRWHARIWAGVRSPDTWRAFGYHLARLPLGVLGFAVVVVAWAAPLQLLLLPIALIGTPTELLSPQIVLPVSLSPLLALGLIPLSTRAVHAVGQFDAAFANAMLGPSDRHRLGERVEQLASTRSDLVDIAEQERRRIERDLHDGAGQQLVALAMTLGMAREKLQHDPERAQALLDEAHVEAKAAISGLRDIVRGISPAILTDRGLGAALSAVAARSSVPVSLVVDVPGRPDETIEGIAYFVVCEALSNAVRHANATHVSIRIVRDHDTLEIEVQDNGVGGADPNRGSGLRGLAGRAAAVDGMFTFDSPPGGPTVLRTVLPANPAGGPITDTTKATDATSRDDAPEDSETTSGTNTADGSDAATDDPQDRS